MGSGKVKVKIFLSATLHFIHPSLNRLVMSYRKKRMTENLPEYGSTGGHPIPIPIDAIGWPRTFQNMDQQVDIQF